MLKAAGNQRADVWFPRADTGRAQAYSWVYGIQVIGDNRLSVTTGEDQPPVLHG